MRPQGGGDPVDPPGRHALVPAEQLLHPLVARGLTARLRLTRLLARFPDRPVWAAFVCINSFITIALLSLVAIVTDTSFVFPSLGPSAFLFFFRPTAASSSPRHAVYGHALGLAAGYLSLWLFGLHHAASTMSEPGLTAPRALAAALSLALTGGAMVLFRVAHPPAAATTLIVSLGFVSTPFNLAVIEAGVVLLVLQAIAINSLAGIGYPLWENPRARHWGDEGTAS